MLARGLPLPALAGLSLFNLRELLEKSLEACETTTCTAMDIIALGKLL